MKTIIIMLLSCISLVAQEPTNLRQKYNAPLSETYLVRSGIYVTVTYAKSGEICEMLISPTSLAESLKGRSRKNIRAEVLTEIIDELVPMNQRGKFVKRSFMNVDCFPDCSYSGDVFKYERVVIFQAKSGVKNMVPYARIRFENAACDN